MGLKGRGTRGTKAMEVDSGNSNHHYMSEMDQTGGRNVQIADFLLQAQAILKKTAIYNSISDELQMCAIYQPCVQHLPIAAVIQENETQVTSLHRDRAVQNLRLLKIFFGFSTKTFALAVNMFDRLLGKVKANPKFLNAIATTCFYVAAKELEGERMIDTAELLKLSQCQGQEFGFAYMENMVLEKLQWQKQSCNPCTFMFLFLEAIFHSLGAKLEDIKPEAFTAVFANMEVLLCQFEFAKYRMETVALALVTNFLEQNGMTMLPKVFASIIELQLYCQISEEEFVRCRNVVEDYLTMYLNQPSKLPRLQLSWTVSRRTLSKMKPSTKVLSDLEPIMEDEMMDGGSEDSTDAGCFDSENDDVDIAAVCRPGATKMDSRIKSSFLSGNYNTDKEMALLSKSLLQCCSLKQ